MDLSSLGLFVGAGVAAYFGGKFLIGQDTKAEDRRRRAIQLGAWCASNGLNGLSRLAENYSVGDYSGVAGELKILVATLGNEADAKAVVAKFLDVQLEKILATPTGKADLLALIEKKRPTTSE